MNLSSYFILIHLRNNLAVAIFLYSWFSSCFLNLESTYFFLGLGESLNVFDCPLLNSYVILVLNLFKRFWRVPNYCSNCFLVNSCSVRNISRWSAVWVIRDTRTYICLQIYLIANQDCKLQVTFLKTLIYTTLVITSLVFLLVTCLTQFLIILSFIGISISCTLVFLFFCLIYPDTFFLPLHTLVSIFLLLFFSFFLCILRSSSWSWGKIYCFFMFSCWKYCSLVCWKYCSLVVFKTLFA